MFFVGYSENIAPSPNVPTCAPCHIAPCACAASSNTHRPCRSAIASSASIGAGCPYRCTGWIPTVRSVIAASTAAGSTVNVRGSTSTNTGVAPLTATVFAVAAKVNEGTITSSPGPRPSASIPRC